MTPFRAFGSVLAAGLLVAATSGFFAASAVSPTKVNIAAGTVTTTGTAVKVTATQSSAVALQIIHNGSGGLSFVCPSLSLTGALKTGANQSPTALGSITSSMWGRAGVPSGCTAGGGSMSLSSTTGSAWQISFTSTSVPASTAPPAPQAGQMARAVITDVSITAVYSNCTFKIVGSMLADYTNANPPTLTVVGPTQVNSPGGGLTVASAPSGGCASGLIVNGDKWVFKTGTPRPVFNVNATAPAGANPVWVNAA